MRLCVGFAALAAGLCLAGAASAEPVLLISIDGLQPADVIEADARGVSAPNLRKFMAEGAYATGVRNALPTVTYPNHTTLVTGAAPSVHGISNNTTFDPYQKNMGGWYWYASDIKAETLWDAVGGKGGVVASIGWPVSVGARAIDWNVPEIWRARTADDLKLLEALSSPGLFAELEKAAGLPVSAIFSEEVEGDVARAKLAAALITLKKPRFMTLHLVSLDHFEHETGPGSEKAKSTLATIDAALGDLVAAARAAEPDIAIAVVSDHGFAAVSKNVNLFVPFIEAGLIKYDPAKRSVTGWEAMPWGAGGAAAIVLARPGDKALRKKVAALLKKLAADPANEIARVIDAKESARQGGGKEASFWVDFKPGSSLMGYAYTGGLVTPATTKGTHGFFPANKEMRASFFIVGGGAAPGRNLGEIDMRDIAPTLARTLGVKLEDATGKALY